MLSLPVGTEMFHFPTFPPHALCVQARVTGDESSRVSPFGNPRIKVRLPTPRGLSQVPTSFFGSWCQGIHRVPLKTWLQRLRCSRPLCSSQATGGDPPKPAPTPTTRSGSTAGEPRKHPQRVPVKVRDENARSLRTQQRARPPHPTNAGLHADPTREPAVLPTSRSATAN